MNKRTAAIAYGLLALGLLVIIVIAARGGSSAPSSTSTENGDIPEAAQITEADHTKGGNQTAPATLIEYGDFQCPACGAYAEVVSGLANQFGNRLQVVFRHYPLTQIHRNANAAAYAAEAAGKQGKFWEMHDVLFERQGQWSAVSVAAANETFLNYAIELGLDGAQFQADRDSAEAKDKVANDVLTGNQLGVRGTPSFFLNGEKIDNPGSAEAFIDLIEATIGDKEVAPVSADDLSKNETVHEHADLAVFLNGEQVDFSLEKYQSDPPADEDEDHDHEHDESSQHDPYVHLHDGVGNIVHKHKAGVTMGYFFETLGMDLTKDCFTDDNDNAYCNGDGNSLKFFVNGTRVQSLADYEFADLDQILISYGPLVDNTITSQLESLTDEACIYSELCPERGEAPTENCVGGLGTDCVQ